MRLICDIVKMGDLKPGDVIAYERLPQADEDGPILGTIAILIEVDGKAMPKHLAEREVRRIRLAE